MHRRRPIALGLLLLLLVLVGCEGPMAQGPDAGAEDAGAALADGGDPAVYPADPRTWTAETCASDQRTAWTFVVPAECTGRRVCFSGGRTYRDGAPWIIRGVYGGGREADLALDACPAGAACTATQPADRSAYVRALADAGFDLVIERSSALSPALRAALVAEPRVGLAHPLFGDPFTMAGHDALALEIEAASADPETLFFFGPDEPDLNGTWPMATGIARLVRGSSPALDALLTGRYAPTTAMPYLPASEPAHDAAGLPYASAVVIDSTGLSVAADVYDAILPVTYPFQEPYSRADDGVWAITRAERFAVPGVPMLPVLQMIPIEGLALIQPSADQIRAEIVGSIALGAAGAFYFQLASDAPHFAGRAAWLALDDEAAWAAYSEMHALWDRLAPVLYGDATVETGSAGPLRFRRFSLGDRRVIVVVNPTPYDRALDLDAIIARADGEAVRHLDDCAPFTTRAMDVPGYFTAVLEIVPRDVPAPTAPGDPLRGFARARPPLTPPRDLGATWETLPPLGAGRSSHTGTFAGGAIRLWGGYTGAFEASAADVTHLLDGTETFATLPFASASAAGGTIDGTSVVAGGLPRFSATERVVPLALVACETGGAWAPCAPVGNGPVSGAAALVFADSLYLCGGHARVDPVDGDLVTTVLQRYTPSLDRWRAESHLPSPRVRAAGLVSEGVLHVVGGQTFSGATGTATFATEVLSYDLVERRWLAAGEPRTLGPLPTPRAALACAIVGGHGYCVGGYGPTGDALATVERVDLSTGAWTAMPDLPEPLSDALALETDGALVIAGGLTASFTDGVGVYRLP